RGVGTRPRGRAGHRASRWRARHHAARRARRALRRVVRRPRRARAVPSALRAPRGARLMNAAEHHALGPGAEFDAVRALVARWGDVAAGVGDDAAVLDVPSGERLLVSTDVSVEGVHFRRAWLSAEEIGYRAAASALSHLAAMGARALGI